MSRLHAHTVFLDETGHSLQPQRRRTWALRGQTPVIPTRTRHRQKISVIGALSVSPRRKRIGLFLQFRQDKNIDPHAVIRFLRMMLEHLRGHVVLIWDNINTHRSKIVKQFIARHRRLHVEPLPPYAPELNAQEHVWCHSKRATANHGLTQLQPLARQLRRHARRLAASPKLLQACFKATPLPMRFPP